MMALRPDPDGVLDLAYDGGLCEGPDIPTAVLISLFSDSRVADESLPAHERRGYWGDASLGNRIWRLARGPLTEQAVVAMRQAAESSLRWLVQDGVASSVDVVAERLTRDSVRLAVTAYRGESVIWESAWKVAADQVEVLCAV